MPNKADIEARFWKALKADRTLMLGLDGAADGHAQPMTVQADDELRPRALWVFTSRDSGLVKAMGARHAAVGHFASKGHDLFASVHGVLTPDEDRATIERFWNPFVAAWFEGGIDDPKLQLIRFVPDSVQIWLNDSSLLAGVRLMLGRDPKKDYKDKVAEVVLL